MDGREIHYSTNRASLLDFSWQTKGNHVVKVICHAAPPLSAQPGFRQYDLLIDGQSFFTMPKVFQIGIKGSVPSNVRGSYGGNAISPVSMGSGSVNRGFGAPSSSAQEEEDLRRAIEASIEESRAHLGESTSTDGRGAPTGDLLDFAAPAPPPAAPPAYAAAPSYPPPADAPSVASMPSYYSAPTTYGPGTPGQAPPPVSAGGGALVPAVAPPGYYQAPPPYGSPAGPPPQSYASPPPVPPAPAPTPAQYGAPPPPPQQQNTDVFGLTSTPVNDPFAPRPPPPPSHQDLASAILSSYQSPPPPGTPGAGGAPQQQHGGYEQPAASEGMNGTPSTPLSMGALAITATEEKPMSALERAMKNLVNVDHIDEPAEGEVKLTMIQKEEKKKVVKGKSVPLPPVGADLVGSNAPLSQIKRDFEKPPKQTTEGIMNAPPPGAFHPNAAMAGALVVHGQGPPPLHQAQGFGIGRNLPNGGFQNQQTMPVGGYMQQQQAQPQYR